MNANQGQDLLTLKEAADLLQVPGVTLRLWADKEKLPSTRTPGGHRRFSREAVLAFGEAHGLVAPSRPGPERPSQGLKVLVVDDDPRWCEMLTQSIRRHHPEHRVECAHSGFAAGRLAARLAPDLVFLDVRMPDISGLDVCRSLKEDNANPGLRVIAITGLASAIERQALLEAGAEAVWKKPLDFEKLHALLDESN